MNCANHPDTPVSSYCQFCGKPLCAQCAHRIQSIVGCEPCLAARVSAGVGAYSVNIDNGKGFQYTATGPLPAGAVAPQDGCCTHPWVAFCLGWIPGVGAMYNGQFAKALVHVLVFAILVDLSNQNGVFGIVLAGWVFYQVFDAYQTTLARRDGLPLPNPLGLNDIGRWFGARPQTSSANPGAYAGSYPASYPGTYPGTAPNAPTEPGTANPTASPGPAPGFAAGFAPGQSAPGMAYSPYSTASMPPVPPDQVDTPDLPRGIPTGAVVLIVLGIAFLLGNLGVLSGYWLDRSWPLLLIGLGVWVAIRRSQTPPAGGGR